MTQACFNGVTLCSNPDDYFYFDGVHPTAKGHAVIARLANDYLYYGDLGSQTAILGETSWRHREDALDNSTAAFDPALKSQGESIYAQKPNLGANGVTWSQENYGHLGLQAEYLRLKSVQRYTETYAIMQRVHNAGCLAYLPAGGGWRAASHP